MEVYDGHMHGLGDVPYSEMLFREALVAGFGDMEARHRSGWAIEALRPRERITLPRA